MSQRSALYFGRIFFFIFLLLTPLGVFNSWIPPNLHTGFYSVTTIDEGDDTGYYAFLRSSFIDGDFDFFNERGYAHAEKINPTGYVFNNWQMGQAILFLPFFLAGHGLAHLCGLDFCLSRFANVCPEARQHIGYAFHLAGFAADIFFIHPPTNGAHVRIFPGRNINLYLGSGSASQENPFILR